MAAMQNQYLTVCSIVLTNELLVPVICICEILYGDTVDYKHKFFIKLNLFITLCVVCVHACADSLMCKCVHVCTCVKNCSHGGFPG